MFNNFKLIFKLLKLDEKAILEIANQKTATIDGIIIIFLSSFASLIGISLFLAQNPQEKISFIPTYTNLTSFSIFVSGMVALFIVFSYQIALLLGGKTTLKQYFRPMAYSQILNVFNLIPSLGFVSLWILVIHYFILIKLNRLTPNQAFLVLMASLLSLFAILTLLS